MKVLVRIQMASSASSTTLAAAPVSLLAADEFPQSGGNVEPLSFTVLVFIVDNHKRYVDWKMSQDAVEGRKNRELTKKLFCILVVGAVYE